MCLTKLITSFMLLCHLLQFQQIFDSPNCLNFSGTLFSTHSDSYLPHPRPPLSHHLSLDPVSSLDTSLPAPQVLGYGTVPSLSWLITILPFQLQISYCVTISFELKHSLLEQGESHKTQEANGPHRNYKTQEAPSWRLENQCPVARESTLQ